MNSQKTYFACLDYEGTLIPGEAVQLGHIIANISEPSDTLNHPFPIPSDIPVLTATAVDSTQQTRKSESKIIHLFLDIPFLRGLGRKRQVESDVNHEYTFRRIDSSWFKPTSGYYSASIADVAATEVHNYLRATNFKLPLYMVVGKKEVIGGGRLRREVSNSVVGMKVKTAVLSRGETRLDDNRYLFAIKVVQLKCSRDGQVSSADYNEGAML
ncbi:hypothetical protein V8E51_018564 [Hyaloscypha variabilis]|uniref:Uncharacterized protein n=1 Tax=Hyaloscypha variabilis (strain UAMH 11265 / GT02V1 / F) TaxID=1149755 RepID=A0A2J6R7R0_HYAVF|nr:hypothetical protein L207DRAFT_516708 [Hyaloscypha variabilis F]